MPTIPTLSRLVYLGIDPGASGGLAIISEYVGVVKTAMPRTERDVLDWLTAWKEEQTFAVIEKVHAMPGNGVSGMFKFGMSYGSLRMALLAANIPFEEIQPRVWQKALGMSPRRKEESGTEWKNRLKAKAQQLFPREVITLATADALLIAEYCRRRREGKLDA